MATYTSVTTGNFNDAATWGGGGYPSVDGDIFKVSSGHIVTVTNVNSGISLGESLVSGTLNFATGSDSSLIFGHASLTIAGGGELKMGISGAVINSGYTAQLLFNPTSDNAKGLVINAGGKITTAGDPEVYGSVDEAALSADWTTGTSFTITGDFSAKWKDGQTLYVHKNSLYSALADTVLVTISGTPSYSAGTGLTTITVTGAPTFPTGGFKSGGKVLNPTRNVIIGKASYTPTVSVSAVSNRPLCTDANTAAGNINIADSEIRAFYDGLAASSGSTLSNQIIRSVIRNCRYGLNVAKGLTFSGIIACCQSYGIINAYDATISGNFIANAYGLYQTYGSSNVSADFVGNSSAGVMFSYGGTFTGRVFSNAAGYYGNNGSLIAGNVYYNSDGVVTSFELLFTGCNYGNTRGFAFCSGIISGKVGYDQSDTSVPNTYDFRFPVQSSITELCLTLRGVKIGTPVMYQNNIAGCGSQGDNYVAFEDYQQVIGAHRKYLPTCDVIKNTSVVRSGGASASMECIPLSNCAANAPALIAEWNETEVPASLQNRSVYIKSSNWGTLPTSSQLYFEAEYYDTESTPSKSVVTSTQTLSDNDIWTEFMISFTPANVGTVRYKIWLADYDEGGGGENVATIYIDNKLYTS